MRSSVLIVSLLLSIPSLAQPAKRAQMLCHRTAGKDAPENTMEALRQAVLQGCDVIELDVRQTLDGVLVLNHDGFTERLTDGDGEVEKLLYDDLRVRDAGSWMGKRWAGISLARLDEALLFAKQQHVQLILDIKTRGIGDAVLRVVDDLNMQDAVRYGGEWEDIRKELPVRQAGLGETWLSPGASAEQITALHRKGERVIVNFSANAHEMDLVAMHAAVENGADGINVDYPRLGADAVGRPVEQKVATLIAQASSGPPQSRVVAIMQLDQYRGLPLRNHFMVWLQDTEPTVSRAAAVALISQRPQASPSDFLPALLNANAGTRASAAWALGALQAPASTLLPLLSEHNPAVLEEALLAITRMPGAVPASRLVSSMRSPDARVRGAAALALACKHPALASTLVMEAYRREALETQRQYTDWVSHGKPSLSKDETRAITDLYRSEMKMLQAMQAIPGRAPVKFLEEQSFHAGDDFLQNQALVAGFQMWDRIGDVPDDAIRELGASDGGVADRAEWMLTMADARVEPSVRRALASEDPRVFERAVRIVAFRGDSAAIPILQDMKNQPMAAWSIAKIRQLQPGAPR